MTDIYSQDCVPHVKLAIQEAPAQHTVSFAGPEVCFETSLAEQNLQDYDVGVSDVQPHMARQVLHDPQGCVTGRYGDQCSTPCPTGCVNDRCLQSGQCSSCKDGWYGDMCSTRCPTGFLNACDQQSSKCASCKSGWYWDQCSTRCPTGCLNDTCLQSGLCSSCKAGYTGSNCSDISDGGDKETVNTTALIGSVIGGALIIGICVIILGVIILKRRSARSEGTRQNNQASNEPIYEIADDRAKATKPSAISDTMYQQSEADSANPYDLPTEQYHNTGDVHLYDHWSDSRAPQQDAQTARAGGSGGKGKAAKQHTPRP
ncbi:hypothetical protein ACOMHN_062699 [Nucella lapillus]